MLKKLVVLGALAVASVVMPAGGAVADPYTPVLPTVSTISASAVTAGEKVTLTVSASANYPTPPAGTFRVTLTGTSGAARGARAVVAAPLLSTTVRFVSEPVRIAGPALPEGTYVATAAFTPDNTARFAPSSATTTVEVGEIGGESEDAPGANGGLPNTGGPNMMWLLLGTGMVAAGAGGVGYSRRREVA